LFRNIIKNTDDKRSSIAPYSMRDMPLHLDSSPSSTSLDSKKKVDHLLKEIEERERYIKQITDKTQSLEKEAYEKGFAQGEKAGMELGEKRFDSVVKSFTKALEEIREIKKELYQKSEQEMVELVLAIARKVIQKEISTDKKIILRMINSALKYTASKQEIRVRLNPSDLEFASQHKEEIADGMEGMKNLIFEGDERVSRGSAVIESNRGIIDCGIEKHLQELENALNTPRIESLQMEG